MNNGYSGTGISIIFYLLLALLMPLVHFARVSMKRNIYVHGFVMRHFLYGIMIIATVVIGISWLISITGINQHAQWHVMLLLSAITTVGLLMLWIAVPIIVKIILWMFRIKPSLPQNYTAPMPKPDEDEHLEYKVIDSVMSRDQWIAFRSKHYGFSKSRDKVSQRSVLW